MTKLELFLATRADALRRGDRSVYRTMTAELERLGIVEDAPGPVFPAFNPATLAVAGSAPVMETATVDAPERAVPDAPKRRGRPPRPRCEHGKIVGRECLDCEEEE